MHKWYLLDQKHIVMPPLGVASCVLQTELRFFKFFSPFCLHHVVVLLLYGYLRGLCLFVWFRHGQKCLLKFVMGCLHVSLTSRLSMKGSHWKTVEGIKTLYFVLLGKWQLRNGINKPWVHWMDCACLVHKICGYYNKGVYVNLIRSTRWRYFGGHSTRSRMKIYIHEI